MKPSAKYYNFFSGGGVNVLLPNRRVYAAVLRRQHYNML